MKPVPTEPPPITRLLMQAEAWQRELVIGGGQEPGVDCGSGEGLGHASGWKHTLLPHAQLYPMKAGGVALTDWIAKLLERSASSVVCDPHCGGPINMSGNQGWECTTGTAGEPAPLESTLDITLDYVSVEASSYPAIEGVRVKACADADPSCASPLAQTTTNAAGRFVLHVPAGKDGFLGTIALDGPDLATRLLLRPAVRNPQHAMVGDNSHYGAVKKSKMAALAQAAGVTYDPGTGLVIADVLDCNLSWRSDVTVDLDGVQPTGYVQPDGSLGATKSAWPVWWNVAPGKHTMHETLAGATTPVAALDFEVGAGTYTNVAGLSPRSVQP
ncbi:MAG: hypothetical protein IPI67_03455 [Myxococcales bacterium]|nr:hypothetical protein [Myxococcales bacterium]